MSRLFGALLALAVFAAAPAAALAQAPPADESVVPERTITIESPEQVGAEANRPGEELIEGGPERTSQGLLPVRDSFVDAMIESADQI